MINYKHLYYFWFVAKQGSITRASEHLHITPQTISGQISLLEENLGKKLFEKAGRNLVLTETGRFAMGYADDIFSLGGELEEAVRNLSLERQMVFKVGVADVVPKTIAHRILAPALQLPDSVRIICKENNLNALLGELALHRIDLVIADDPIPANLNVSGFNHLLGESGISFLAANKLADSLSDPFPQCLNGAPLLMPSPINRVHDRLLQWFDQLRVYPKVVGEFDDSALMKVFGQAGNGLFIAPTVIAEEVARQYNAQIIGATDDVSEQFYAISVERRISHPAVMAITEAARNWLK